MRMPVSQTVLQETIHCDHDFLCQKPKWMPCGPVSREVEGVLLYKGVTDLSRRPCSYYVDFGGGDYCTCPARLEIYRRYGV